MRLDFDIRFDLKSISSHAWRRCCSQPGASLEIDFKSPKGGMSRHNQGLKIDFKCFFGCVLQRQLEIDFKSSISASLLLAATTVCLTLAKLLSGPLCADYRTLLQGFCSSGLIKGTSPRNQCFLPGIIYGGL